MTELTYAERETPEGLTALTEAEIDAVAGGTVIRGPAFFFADLFSSVTVTPSGNLLQNPGSGNISGTGNGAETGPALSFFGQLFFSSGQGTPSGNVLVSG